MMICLVCLFAALATSETVELKFATSTCSISRQGARVVSYRAQGREVLWNADPVQLTDADWAHGGISFCWPWFGVNAEGRIHGQSWRDSFRFLSKEETPTNAVARFSYALGEGVVDYRIELTEVLRLTATVRNAGTNVLSFTGGFHPYFRVGERNRTSVSGLDGLSFADDPSFANPQSGVWHGVVRVTNVIDRLYVHAAKRHACRLEDASLGRCIEVVSKGTAAIGVWNPGEIKNYPGSLPEDAWRRFVCVEPVCCGSDQEVHLKPGESRTLSMSVKQACPPNI